MKFKAHLLWRAERDLDHILSWLNERSPTGASKWLRRWDETFAILESSANEYGLAPESEGQEMEIRQILFHVRKGRDYRALYVIRDNDVFVTHIRAPGQDFVSPDDVRLP